MQIINGYLTTAGVNTAFLIDEITADALRHNA